MAAPLWLPLAALSDLARKSRGAAVRSGLFIVHYLSCEVLGVTISAALWVWRLGARPEEARWTDLHFRLEAWWGALLFHGMKRIFGLELSVQGEADLGSGPYLLLVRHASTADTLLAAALISWPHGLRLRYVLKRELLWDPCLDIVGHRVPNVFVDRFADDSAGEIRRIEELARDLGPRDGLLIYPEGTRFSLAKRRRVIERFERSGDIKLREYARSLDRVLPPRLGGTLALLEAAPQADVVICAHTGFEDTASLGAIWRGALVHQRVQVQFQRVPHAEIPAGRDARALWLLDAWRQVDVWVSSAGRS